MAVCPHGGEDGDVQDGGQSDDGRHDPLALPEAPGDDPGRDCRAEDPQEKPPLAGCFLGWRLRTGLYGRFGRLVCLCPLCGDHCILATLDRNAGAVRYCRGLLGFGFGARLFFPCLVVAEASGEDAVLQEQVCDHDAQAAADCCPDPPPTVVPGGGDGPDVLQSRAWEADEAAFFAEELEPEGKAGVADESGDSGDPGEDHRDLEGLGVGQEHGDERAEEHEDDDEDGPGG